MKPVYDVASIRAAEHAHGTELADGTLMERASFGLAMTCLGILRSARGRVSGSRVVVLAGKGGNAGDALFAAARLRDRGCRVDVIMAWDTTHEAGLAACVRAGARVLNCDAPSVELMMVADLVIDGLVGIGATGALRQPADVLARATHVTDAIVVAVDVPSGIDADTGAAVGDAVRADITVTFAALKPGLLTGVGREHAGTAVVVDIGVDDAFGEPEMGVIQEADVAGWLREPESDDHKYRRGVVGLAVGSAEYPGAGELVTQAAACGLAGMVMSLRPSAVPDVVPLVAVGDGRRVSAWVCGSGWAQPDETLLRELILTELPLVVDGGAIGSPLTIADGRSAALVFTPHEGEFTRLSDADLGDRIAAAQSAAKQRNAVVVLKGPGTVIADADGRVLIDELGGSELAVAGSGDVLAGIIGALLASGLGGFEAAAAGVWLHSAAGALAARSGEPVSGSSIAAAVPAAVAWARRGPAAVAEYGRMSG